MTRSIGTATALLAAGLIAGATPASAQTKELSEKSIQTMMQYAWTLMLPKFTANGKEVIVDLDKPAENMVPIDVAREVIRVGRISANTQMCGLSDEQPAIHGTLMKREADKKKWTDQQMMFINQLHLFTVMLMTGGVKVVEKEGDKEGAKEVVLESAKLAPPKSTCTEVEAKKVLEQAKAYYGGDAKK